MKIVAVVPIKLTNERFQGKNIRMLGCKPLIQYILDTLLDVELIDEIYVYCSNIDICEYLVEGVNFLKRNPDLDLPTVKFSDIQIPFSRTIPADVYVLAHCTAPFLTKNTIKKCITSVVSSGYDSAFAAEILQDFLWMDGKPLNFNPLSIPRTQDLPYIYKESTGIYVYRNEILNKYHRRIGFNPYIAVISGKEALDIDYLEDFELAEYYIMKGDNDYGLSNP